MNTATAIATKSSQQRRRRRTVQPPPLEPWEREYVVSTTKDFLTGRGGKTNANEGNRDVLKLVRSIEREYAGIKIRGQKGRFAQQIVNTVQNGGGRFLQLDELRNQYYVMEPAKAVKLVQQKFRDHPNRRAAAKSRKSNAITTDATVQIDGEHDDDLSHVQSTNLAAVNEQGLSVVHPTPSNAADHAREASSVHCVSPTHSIDEAHVYEQSTDADKTDTHHDTAHDEMVDDLTCEKTICVRSTEAGIASHEDIANHEDVASDKFIYLDSVEPKLTRADNNHEDVASDKFIYLDSVEPKLTRADNKIKSVLDDHIEETDLDDIQELEDLLLKKNDDWSFDFSSDTLFAFSA